MKHQVDYRVFSKAIKGVRQLGKIGIREAAKQIGISPATLSRLENQNMPTLINYVSICEWLNVPLETFIIKSLKRK